MYSNSWQKCHDRTREAKYRGDDLYYFANGYAEAVLNIRRYGLDRVERNLTGEST